MTLDNLIIIGKNVKNVDLIENSINNSTEIFLVGSDTTEESLLNHVKEKTYKSVAYFAHYQSPETHSITPDVTYNLASNKDALVNFWNKFDTSTIDYLGCSTLKNEVWKNTLKHLEEKTSKQFRASDDNTGNLKAGGDWVLESDGVNVKDIYFTEEINNWMGLLSGISLSVLQLSEIEENIEVSGSGKLVVIVENAQQVEELKQAAGAKISSPVPTLVIDIIEDNTSTELVNIEQSAGETIGATIAAGVLEITDINGQNPVVLDTPGNTTVSTFPDASRNGATAISNGATIVTGTVGDASLSISDLLESSNGDSIAENEIPDGIAPVITVTGDNPASVELGYAYTDAGATAEDVVDGDLTSSIVTVSTVDVTTAGTYAVTYTSTDKSDNTATATRTVKVVVTQSLYLNKGWNLVSFYVKPADFSIENIFNGNETEPKEIKGGVSYLLGGGDRETTLKVSEAYWIEVSKSFTINVIGVVPEDVKQDLKRGLNSFDLTGESIKNVSPRLYFLTKDTSATVIPNDIEFVVREFLSVFDPENDGLTLEDLNTLGGEQQDFNGIGTNEYNKITFGELITYINSNSDGLAVINNLSEITKVVKEFFSVFATESDGLTLKDIEALGGELEDFINIDTNTTNTISPRELLIFLNSSNNDDDEGDDEGGDEGDGEGDDEGGLEFLKENIKIGKIVREFLSVFDSENGGLTLEDLNTLGAEEAVFNDIDINSDSKITFRELITFIFSDEDVNVDELVSGLNEFIRVGKIVREFFSVFDPENNGLTLEDLVALGGEQEDFDGIGTNDDGKITFRELITFIFGDDKDTDAINIPLLLKEYIKVGKS